MKYLSAALCVLMGVAIARAEDPPPIQIVPITTIEAPPETLPIPKIGPPPEVPGATPSIECLCPMPIAGQGPLYLDVQTYRPVGRDLAALLRHGADVKGAIWSDHEPIHAILSPDTAFKVDGLLRGYYRNDQRIEWSGVEATFGAEGAVSPTFVTLRDDWIVTAHGELFLNKRFGPAMIRGPFREAYRANFEVDTFELFQFFIEATHDDLSIRLGRSRTPFGRYQSPMFTNSMLDAPFLRTDVIGFIETGLFIRYHPGPLVLDLACVNGEPDLDTNSSKGVVGRIGYEEEFWTVGVSAKYHDGVSSEFQKRYDNQFGMDASVVIGRWTVYSEAVYDQHGFQGNPITNPEFDPSSLGVRSLYGRDLFRGENLPISGIGAYLGVTCRGEKWVADLSYGYYRPSEVGDLSHDEPINRLLFKAAYRPGHHLQFFVAALAENRRPLDPFLSRMNPYAVFAGMQYAF